MSGLTDEQREELAEELLLSGFTEGTRRTVLDALAPLIARMVTEAEQRGRADHATDHCASGYEAGWLAGRGQGRAEISAAVEAVAQGGVASTSGGDGKFVSAHRVRAVLTDPAAAVARIKAEAWDEGFTRGFYDVLAGGDHDASESAAVNPHETSGTP